MIEVLQRIFPGTDFWHWYAQFRDFRAKLADRLGCYTDGFLESDDAFEALEKAASVPPA